MQFTVNTRATNGGEALEIDNLSGLRRQVTVQNLGTATDTGIVAVSRSDTAEPDVDGIELAVGESLIARDVSQLFLAASVDAVDVRIEAF